jgi:high affinity sulfate transporter 1
MADVNAEKKGGSTIPGRVLPAIVWLRSYEPGNLGPDLLAGVIVAAFTVPDAMANASLAGVPLQLGLYASIMALLAYAIFGTSRQLSIGPPTTITILAATALGAMAGNDPSRYVTLMVLTALAIGAIAVVARALKLSFIVNLISGSVLTGVYCGTGLVIVIAQLPKLLGFRGIQGGFFEQAYFVLTHLGLTNLYAAAVGVGATVLLLLFQKRLPRVPGPIVVIVLAILLMVVTGWAGNGVDIVGRVPQGLPSIGIPSVTLADVAMVLPLAAACYLIGYISDFSVADRFAKEHRYEYDADQELLAVGAANFGSGLAGGFPVGPSMVRSTVNDANGAKTPLAGLISALLIGLVILFFTGLFTNMPAPALAALIMVASLGLINVPALHRIAGINKAELAIAIAAMFFVLTVGMLAGIIIGVLLSILEMLRRVSYPHVAVLGRLPGSDQFADRGLHPEAMLEPGVAIFRVDASVIFANARTVKKVILESLDQVAGPVKIVVLDLASTPMLDITGMDMIDELSQQLYSRGITLKLANMTGQVRDTLAKSGFEKRFGRTPESRSIASILAECRIESGDDK